MSRIVNLFAREILDSRGNPTIEVDVVTELGNLGRASVPSGASTGSLEALELRDGGIRYNGKGVLNAVSNVNNIISKKIIGMEVCEQESIDRTMIELDGTENKSNLGANAILGVSLAVLKAAALDSKLPLFRYSGMGSDLPIPMMNIINGGAHADNGISFQEFMIVPLQKTFKERLRVGTEVFYSLRKLLKENNYSTNVGDEGGFAPNLKSNIEALDYIVLAIKNAGYNPGSDVKLAIDVAASEFYDKEQKKYIVSGDIRLDSNQLIDMYVSICEKYPIMSIEDPLDEKDYDSWEVITKRLGNKIMLIGDDLFVTNKELLDMGIKRGIANSILLKVNQIGTVTETLDTIKLAKENGYKTIISHRSGETEDIYISHFAVGLSLGMIKTGSLSRGERVSKYNELLRIEEILNENINNSVMEE